MLDIWTERLIDHVILGHWNFYQPRSLEFKRLKSAFDLLYAWPRATLDDKTNKKLDFQMLTSFWLVLEINIDLTVCENFSYNIWLASPNFWTTTELDFFILTFFLLIRTAKSHTLKSIVINMNLLIEKIEISYWENRFQAFTLKIRWLEICFHTIKRYHYQIAVAAFCLNPMNNF